MTEAEKFEKLMESNPAQAMKYVKEFEDTVFWKYFKANLIQDATDLLGSLYSCDLEVVPAIRGKLTAHSEIRGFVESITEQLKDEIALQKEAAKIEEARTPEEEK